MQLIYRIPTIEEVFLSTLWTQKDHISPFIQDRLYCHYPELDKSKILALPWDKREEYLKKELAQIYYFCLPELKYKAEHWNEIWNKDKNEIEQLFSFIFKIDATKVFNHMVGLPNLNPICPRDLGSSSFFLFYRYDDLDVLRVSLHEIIHFFWFYCWQAHFHDDYKEYEAPSLKWLYSEMVVDTFARFTDLKKFNGDFLTAYDYFYTCKIENENILDILGNIYQERGIDGLLKDGFNFIKRHAEKIPNLAKKDENTT